MLNKSLPALRESLRTFPAVSKTPPFPPKFFMSAMSQPIFVTVSPRPALFKTVPTVCPTTLVIPCVTVLNTALAFVPILIAAFIKDLAPAAKILVEAVPAQAPRAEPIPGNKRPSAI